MRVCLINPCNFFELVGNDPVIIKEQQGILPPLGLLYIAAYLKQTGRYEVRMIDAQVEGLDHEQIGEEVEKFKPDAVGIMAMTFTLQDVKRVVAEVRKRTKAPLIIGGPHVIIYPNETLDPRGLGADYAVMGEGEITMDELLQAISQGKADKKIWRQEKFIEDLDALPFPARELTPYEKYYSVLSVETPTSSSFSSRGCPYHCLTGDTLVNTVEGDIQIRDLVGREKIGVYTYNLETRELFIADAFHIKKYGVGKTVVRVEFDDGTYIDCTPDHKFLMFKNRNQSVGLREYPTEAKDLKFGMSVRAFREELSGRKGNQYTEVTWARRSRKKKHRLIMEYILGRELSEDEPIHHKNHNRLDNNIANLEYCESHKDHVNNHPEISERMRNNNPAWHMTQEWKNNISKAVSGKKRTFEQRIRYAKSKIGSKNPQWKGHGEPGYRSKYKEYLEVNHKVVSVRTLSDKQDVYCLTVPSTGWFFANKVLVKNCAFCDRPALGKGFRAMTATRVVDEIEWCVNHGIKEIFFYDDTFSVSKKRVHEICNEIKRRGISTQGDDGHWKHKLTWDVRTRVNVVDEALLQNMREAGCERIHFGIESGVPRVIKELAKGITTEQVEDAFALCKKYGIKTLAYFMMGNPTETHEDIKATLELSRRIEPDFMQMTILSPFPATAIYFRALKDGLIKSDIWKQYAIEMNDDFRPPLWLEKFTRQELESELRWFYSKFYLNGRFIKDRILEVRNVPQFKRYAKAGLSLLRMTLVPESKLKDSWGLRNRLKGQMAVSS